MEEILLHAARLYGHHVVHQIVGQRDSLELGVRLLFSMTFFNPK